ncbi:MAG: EAL domain-containing protein [Lachnospiraceae bacterium]|nr:EAL domain-containing protein [Lachnospiraceae bacterium]
MGETNELIGMNGLLENRLQLKRRVLVVDDEAINRRLMEKIISERYEVLQAGDGEEALEIIRANSHTLSLILLDLLMPKLDGYELMKILRADETLKRIPVIVLTSEKNAEVEILDMGAADFLQKPYDVPEVILARINRAIKLYDSINIINATQTDSLTDLFNKDYFIEYVQMIDQYYPNRAMDAIAVNISRFHIFNEMNGRAMGDELLKALGETIKTCAGTRKGIACRNAADRFYMYVLHEENPENIRRSIIDGISHIMKDAENRVDLGVYPNAQINPDRPKRFDCALLACNSIRSDYNSFISFYDAEMYRRETFAEKLLSDFDTALEQKQFIVHYQPKFNITGDTPYLSSAEALVRWKHPELGMISLGLFIPFFEENGLIQRLDRYVWKEVADQIASWKKDFGISVPVSINVSRIDIMSPDLVSEIENLVKSSGITADDLYLEITESAYTEDSDRIVEAAEKLRELGFKIEMDDFGTGYSSLNVLSILPVDVLKLDMEFIKSLETNPKSIRLIELVVDIAAFLNAAVVVEGVESKEQYEILKRAGVDIIQGYYFSAPVDSTGFEKFINERIEYDNSRKA